MATRPDADGFARIAIWGGALIIAGSSIVNAIVGIKAEWLWVLIGLFYIFLGLLILPKHPEHYLDFDNEEAVAAQKTGWSARRGGKSQ